MPSKSQNDKLYGVQDPFFGENRYNSETRHTDVVPIFRQDITASSEVTKCEKDKESSKECPPRNSKSLGEGKSEGESNVKTLQDTRTDVSSILRLPKSTFEFVGNYFCVFRQQNRYKGQIYFTVTFC